MTKEELEKEISILLSCNNCPDNKGGFICQKEYEDKCLAQKIQYIKELKEEIAELKEKYVKNICDCDICDTYCNSQLIKAKEIIRELLSIPCDMAEDEFIEKAENFLKESEVEDEHKFAFMQGYAKCETDEMFRTKQVVTKDSAEVIKLRNQVVKAKEHIRTLISCLIDWVQEGDKDYCHIAEAEQFLKELEK